MALHEERWLNKLPCEILREHYHYHPQIIEFCNQKYYDGKLIPYTNPNLSEYPLVLYKTVEGNHMRQVHEMQRKETIINGSLMSSRPTRRNNCYPAVLRVIRYINIKEEKKTL